MIEIITEVGRGLTKKGGESVERALEGACAVIARVMGERIKERVSRHGDVAGQAVTDWDDTYEGVLVSARYPGAERGKLTRSGARLFKTNRDFHIAIGARRGHYSMEGLSRVIMTPTLVHLRFRGRSEGQNARIINGKSRPLRISNALKAWTVYTQKRVHLLAMSEVELAAVESAVTHAAALAASNVLPIEWKGEGPGGASVEAVIRRALQRPAGGSTVPDGAPGL